MKLVAFLFLSGVVLSQATLDRRHGDEDTGTYQISNNLFAALLVFLFSVMGCGFASVTDKLKIPLVLVDLGRHFGTGVIVATAFIHMLVGSIMKLQDSRLPPFISEFESFGAMVALAAIFLMHLLETLLASPQRADPYTNINAAHHHCHFPSVDQKKTTTTYILELGILSHSVFIGLALGLKRSTNFLTLLLAICFHQFFEGIGLGARISQLKFPTSRTPALMILAYSLTTSLGILLGIAIHTTYDPQSIPAIATEGCLDAVSAGILIYTGLVELMGRDLSSEFGLEPNSRKGLFLGAMYLGAAAMTVLAVWA